MLQGFWTIFSLGAPVQLSLSHDILDKEHANKWDENCKENFTLK